MKELLQELHVLTTVADKRSAKYIGCLPASRALNSASIGEATVNGKLVYITWGRNLNKEEQEYYMKETTLQPIYTGTNDGTAELIIPEKDAEKLLLVLLRNWLKFICYNPLKL